MATFDLTSEQQRHVFEFIQTHPIPSELKVTPVKLQAAFNMAVALARAVEMQPGFTEAGIGPGAALGFVTPTQVGFTVGQLNIASGLLTALQPVTVKPPSMLKTEMMTFLTLVETIEHEAEVELPTLAEVFGITSVTVTTVPTDKEVEALTPASLRHVPSNFDPTIQG